MFCGECGEKLGRPGYVESRTAIFYQWTPDHTHDDNCTKRTYYCSSGHGTNLSIINRCYCGWVGKRECFCALKVDKWPVL